MGRATWKARVKEKGYADHMTGLQGHRVAKSFL